VTDQIPLVAHRRGRNARDRSIAPREKPAVVQNSWIAQAGAAALVSVGFRTSAESEDKLLGVLRFCRQGITLMQLPWLWLNCITHRSNICSRAVLRSGTTTPFSRKMVRLVYSFREHVIVRQSLKRAVSCLR